MNKKIFSSASTQEKNWKKAIEELAQKIQHDLQHQTCHLLIFFISENYPDFHAHSFLEHLLKLIPCQNVIGCNSSGVIGDQTEIEMQPGISLMAMYLPEVEIHPFWFAPNKEKEFENSNDLIQYLDIYPTDHPYFLCLADSMTCDIQSLLSVFNKTYPEAPVIGGLASGMVMGASNWLALNRNIYTEGAIGLALIGNIELEIIISQGCRPIGNPMTITHAHKNIIYQIAGQSALKMLQELLISLPIKDQTLAQNALLVGLAMNEYQAEFKRGDFLIRNIIGIDPDKEALIVGALIKNGQTIQFQLRDSETSKEDLKYHLEHSTPTKDHLEKGAFLVTCCGRGKNLYGQANHDIQMIQSIKGPLPITGFFANGEIGPIGHKNFVHGYTSSLIIVR